MKRVTVFLMMLLVFLHPWRGWASTLCCASFARGAMPCVMPEMNQSAIGASEDKPPQSEAADLTKDGQPVKKYDASCCQLCHLTVSAIASDSVHVFHVYGAIDIPETLNPPPERTFKPPNPIRLSLIILKKQLFLKIKN